MQDLNEYPSTVLSSVAAHYGVTLADVESTNEGYEGGTSGCKCGAATCSATEQ